MIDPRLLHQHFKSVSNRNIPPKQEIPRVIAAPSLTSLQAIPMDSVIDTKNEKINEIETQKIDLVINNFEPIDQIIIDENEDESQTSNTIKQDYDPYDYYRNPLF